MKCGKAIDLKGCGKKTKHAQRGRAALGFRDAKSREAKPVLRLSQKGVHMEGHGDMVHLETSLSQRRDVVQSQ